MKQGMIGLGLVIVVFVLSPLTAQAQLQKRDDFFTDRFIATPKDFEAWRDALNTATKSENKKMLFAMFPLIDGLWKGAVFQEAVSRKYVARIPNVPKQNADEWVTALEDACGGSRDTLYALITLVQQDRLFLGTEFQAEQFKTLLLRLKSMPKEAISKWLEVSPLDDLFDSAISLMKHDELFIRNVFQQNLFEEKLNQQKAIKKT